MRLSLALCVLAAGCQCRGPVEPDAGDCTVNVVCLTNPGGECRLGKTACTRGVTSCVDTGTSPAGTPCGDGGVCSPEGSCGPCTQWSACATNPGGPCQRGELSCATGQPRCLDAELLDAGAACGTDRVCDLDGRCVACAASAPCSDHPAVCRRGALDCSAGPVCRDDAFLAAGTACGTGLTCDGDGGCRGCPAVAACATNPSPCRTGVTACTLGAVSCVDSSFSPAGQSCGTDQVCTGDGGCIACQQGASCALGGGCRLGTVACATGSPVCLPAGEVDAGTACAGGACSLGVCVPLLWVNAPVNLSRDVLTAGRACAESPAFAVLEFTDGGAVLAPAPDAGCLAIGDEVLLIKLQGTGAAIADVGAWETLRVAALAGPAVQFQGARRRTYGDPAGTDEGLSDGGQKVMLLRVASFSELVVGDAGVITADPWDGRLNGVVALKALRLELYGRISAQNLGYRAGRWSSDDVSCSDSLATEAGESISGRGGLGPDAGQGGSGGLGAGTSVFAGNNVVGSTPGHAQPGRLGGNFGARAAAEPGQAYGSADGGTLTLGSSGGGNLTCSSTTPQGPLLVTVAVPAPGIVFIEVGTLTVRDGGSITASGRNVDTRVATTGGSVMLRGDVLELGAGAVTALGGIEAPFGAVPATPASPGYISVFYATSVTGTTNPPAFTAQLPNP